MSFFFFVQSILYQVAMLMFAQLLDEDTMEQNIEIYWLDLRRVILDTENLFFLLFCVNENRILLIQTQNTVLTKPQRIQLYSQTS